MTRQSVPSASASTPLTPPTQAAGMQDTDTESSETQASQTPSMTARGLAGAAFLVMVFFVLSRVTGLLREVTIGNQFGTSAEYDAYLAAFRMPDILFQLVAGGALGSAFIPTFTQYW